MKLFEPADFTNWDENNLIRIGENQSEKRILALIQRNLETNQELIDWAQAEILEIQEALKGTLTLFERVFYEARLRDCEASIIASEMSTQRIEERLKDK